MHYSVLLVLILLTSLSLKADYKGATLTMLIEKSPSIFLAKILDVEDSTLICFVEKKYKGILDSDTVRIKRGFNWACDWRYGKYEAGQKSIWFVKKVENGIYQMAVNGGFDSEMPLSNEYVYFQCYENALEGAHDNYGKFLINEKNIFSGLYFDIKDFEYVLKNYDNLKLQIKRLDNSSDLLNFYPENRAYRTLVEDYVFHQCKSCQDFKFDWVLKMKQKRR